MCDNFKMKVDVTIYSYIIHAIYAIIFFLVNIFNLQYYSVYVLCASKELLETAPCCKQALIIAIELLSFLIFYRRALKIEELVYYIEN